MAMSMNNAPLSPNHPYFLTAKLLSPRGALAGPMRILFLAPKFYFCPQKCAIHSAETRRDALKITQAIITLHWRRFRCPAFGSTSVSMSPTSLGSPRVSRRVHCHHLRADVTRSAATGHPRPRALDPPARARIPRRAREPPTRGDNTCGGERGSVPLPVGLTNREPCPRVVRIAGNAFFSSKPRFDREKIRLQCKLPGGNDRRTAPAAPRMHQKGRAS